MNTSNTTLSLKVHPEERPFITAIIKAKAAGDWKAVKRRREQYEALLSRLEMEELIRRHNERSRQAEELERLQKEEELRLAEEEWDRFAAQYNFYETADGWEFLPSHSGQKGWRRILSEFVEDRRGTFWLGEWGGRRYRIRSNATCSKSSNFRNNKHNCGRKPRKPWFK